MTLFAFDRSHRGPAPADQALTIGLVNNMPDTALKSTERQFRELLTAAASGMPVALRVFSFPELPRSIEGQRHVAAHHEPIEKLWASRIDGLIVTGAAPVAATLEEEPSWPMLKRLVEWAEGHTRSTVWSCLASHAAVRHLDGIERRPLPAKLSGVYECRRTDDHPLLGILPARWMTPHSRYNELPEAALRARGYSVLSRSRDAGADIFVKRCSSLFVFLQGHPEYDAGALGREYRRDVGHFLAGKRDDYPKVPANYFSADLAAAMHEFRDAALRDRGSVHLDRFPALPSGPVPWQGAAAGFYAAWLAQLERRRSRRARWTGFALPADAARGLTPTYA